MTYRPSAIIVDIDGTMAHRTERGPFDWDRVGEDLPNIPVLETVRGFKDRGYVILFVSGRLETCKMQTIQWLARYYSQEILASGSKFWRLYMRPVERQFDNDYMLKEDIYRKRIEPNYGVLLVLDDRDSVVNMWREIGLTCFQVAPGAF